MSRLIAAAGTHGVRVLHLGAVVVDAQAEADLIDGRVFLVAVVVADVDPLAVLRRHRAQKVTALANPVAPDTISGTDRVPCPFGKRA